jgi:arylformamidase
MMAPELPRALVKAGVALSGLFDLEPLVAAAFVNVDLKLDAALARDLSPTRLTPATQAPLLTAVGGDESDEFHRQSRLIAQAWPTTPVSDVKMPGFNHLTVCEALADPASPLFAATLRLIRGTRVTA